jgi:putative DNA primase/helicase
MQGKRFVVAHENKEGARLAEDLLKLLTGGDRIRARRLYSNSVEFDPTWKLWLSVNHMPIISATDPAIWDRLYVIPFDVCFAGRENRGLKQQLLEERAGIVAWLVKGYRKYLESGLNPPECVRVCSDRYRRSMNPLADFVDDECVLRDGLEVVGGRLYERYRQYCDVSGNRYPVGRKRFTALLAEMGVERGRAGTSNGDRTYTGIALKESASDTSDRSYPKKSSHDFSMEDFLEEEVSERQEDGKPLSFLEIPPCEVCASDTFYRRQPGGPLLCCVCRPYSDLSEVAEFVMLDSGSRIVLEEL